MNPLQSPVLYTDAVASTQSPIHKRQGSYLPHWTRDEATYAVTFRLGDALPTEVLKGFLSEREEILARAEYTNRPLSDHELTRLAYLHSERIEQFLDSGHGACWMKRPEIARVVRDAKSRPGTYSQGACPPPKTPSVRWSRTQRERATVELAMTPWCGCGGSVE